MTGAQRLGDVRVRGTLLLDVPRHQARNSEVEFAGVLWNDRRLKFNLPSCVLEIRHAVAAGLEPATRLSPSARFPSEFLTNSDGYPLNSSLMLLVNPCKVFLPARF